MCMEYIDKHDVLRINAFNALVDTFITRGIFHYKDLNGIQRAQIRDFLRNEQNSLCAYCMQKDLGGSVEHVIAQYISRQDFGRAIHCGNFFPQFIHQGSFVYSSLPIQYYPHTLAYGNLVYSCESCNSKRDRDIIHPNYFDNPTGVSYGVDGKVYFSKDLRSIEMKSYLNEDAFRVCRTFWAAVKLSGKTIADVASLSKITDKRKFLMAVIPQMPRFMQNIFSNGILYFCSKAKWELLVSYEWFWGYY